MGTDSKREGRHVGQVAAPVVLVVVDNELAEHCDRQLTMNAGELVETTGANTMNKKEAV